MIARCGRTEQALRLLIAAMFVRSQVFRGTRRSISRQAFLWLRSRRAAAELLHDGS